jgi:hypothetical protein
MQVRGYRKGSMNVVTAYRSYMRVAYVAALQGVFDFNEDYRAYCAMTAGDADLISKMEKNRRKALGFTPKQVLKFKKGLKKPVKGSLEDARKRYDKAKGEFYANYKPEGPMHLVKTTGKQGTKAKPEGTLVAHYSHKRPKRVLSAFGEADNTEVF